MGYLSINNLYKDQQILQFKEVYALEKIHGTSANVSWSGRDGHGIRYFSGGESYDRFVALFDHETLKRRFEEKFGAVDYPVIIYGEAYGGKQQGMSDTYGKDLRFVAFDVNIDGNWLQVEQAARLVESLGLVCWDSSRAHLCAMEFVDYAKIPSTLPAIDAERDRPSTQAQRNGISDPKIREGVVLRPPFEVTLNDGERLIAKHKREEFRETGRPRPLVSSEKAEVQMRTQAIVEEWVVPMRFEHVIDQLIRDREEKEVQMADIPALIRLMTADVLREGAGEFVVSDEKVFGKAVGAKVVKMLKEHIQRRLHGNHSD